MTNFILGKYVMYAVNAPKKYPDKPLMQDLKTDDKSADNMDDTDRARLDALFGAMAQQSDKLPNLEPESPENGPGKATKQKL